MYFKNYTKEKNLCYNTFRYVICNISEIVLNLMKLKEYEREFMYERIKSYLHTDDVQTQLIWELYSLAKQYEPKVELQFRRTNLVGVGVPTEYLRFYLVSKNNSLIIKFKDWSTAKNFNGNDFSEYKQQVKETNEYFKSNDMTLKDKPKDEHNKINMSRFQALQLFARGIEPTTGEILFTPSLETTQLLMNLALFVLQKERNDTQSFYIKDNYNELIQKELSQKNEKPIYENRGKKWTQEEDNTLLQEYKNLVPIETIANNHCRSQNAITRRLIALNVIFNNHNS